MPNSLLSKRSTVLLRLSYSERHPILHGFEVWFPQFTAPKSKFVTKEVRDTPYRVNHLRDLLCGDPAQ